MEAGIPRHPTSVQWITHTKRLRSAPWHTLAILLEGQLALRGLGVVLSAPAVLTSLACVAGTRDPAQRAWL